MANGRSNGSDVKLLKRVMVMLAAGHRENRRRIAGHERWARAHSAENERRIAQNEERISQNERLLVEQKEELAELKKITTINSKAIIKLLSR